MIDVDVAAIGYPIVRLHAGPLARAGRIAVVFELFRILPRHALHVAAAVGTVAGSQRALAVAAAQHAVGSDGQIIRIE